MGVRLTLGRLRILVFLIPLVGFEAHAKESAQPTLQELAEGDHRLDKRKARNKYRHPVETLKFFGLKPGMTVVEIWPGGGWYTDIIAPYVMKNGKYYAAGRNKDTKNKRIQASIKRYDDRLAKYPKLFGKVIVTQLSQNKTDIAPAGSADLVLTFRNIHNWMKFGFDRTIFDAMYKALRPGGILGIVEHRQDPDEFPDPQTLSGYVHEEQVKEMARAAGFAFVAKSEINANPKDNHKHPKGVWTLPPTLRLKDKDRQKYLAIGESDRMTMMFRKLVY